ncbi:phosphonate metabolism transcriptional regulator PhnF [Roseovarius indicus]|uniref:GntR family transcriptional regulator n=1 Tax=Roseovarius indicus TaxID=540747 RepID=A0A0T5P1X0_9RHOB|nr:phosphonate metabolism transcriptional regulator PhnF [Roseovarius indicus]KRS15122.1 GntR family transcriptional regulator [Roseovarius indicus]QEW24766.1 HTH-type transcriptional repressor DasR [Roseovarius indicus]SFE51982.1 transcriptional regulator, GntR family [Roseovarius indicus]
MTTDTAKRTPIWKSIHDTLLRDISERRYAPGDKLPTEAALARRFGVNRHTVRRALATLAEDGLVHARRGAGVFVAQSHTDYPIGKRVRFHQNLRAAGHLPGKQLLAMETRAADTTEAELLALTQGDPVHVYEGLSLSDGQPVALFQSVFPAARFPGLPDALTRLRSVTAALADQGLDDYTRAWTRLNAKLATPTQALHLQLREGAPLLRTISLNIDADGKPVEYGRTWFSGDRVTLTVADP